MRVAGDRRQGASHSQRLFDRLDLLCGNARVQDVEVAWTRSHALPALEDAEHGIRVNAILGLMNTPMAIEGIVRARGRAKEEVIAPATRKYPSATEWAPPGTSLWRCSSPGRGKFITGVLPVDGGQSARIG
jgi:NAD(P)-dependent dehydrogenase (short-subunit alcohol dehydrogenase family)